MDNEAPILTEQMISADVVLVDEIKQAGEQAGEAMSQDEFLEWLSAI